MASTIIGVSSYKQLDEVLAAASLELNSEILEALDGIEEDIPTCQRTVYGICRGILFGFRVCV